jgi:hypothetical protein
MPKAQSWLAWYIKSKRRGKSEKRTQTHQLVRVDALGNHIDCDICSVSYPKAFRGWTEMKIQIKALPIFSAD